MLETPINKSPAIRRLAEQIIKRDLAAATENEKIETWNRAARLSKNNLRPDLMFLTLDREFLLEIAYYEKFWREIGINPSQVDHHYSTLRAAAAWDYIEQCFEPAIR